MAPTGKKMKVYVKQVTANVFHTIRVELGGVKTTSRVPLGGFNRPQSNSILDLPLLFFTIPQQPVK